MVLVVDRKRFAAYTPSTEAEAEMRDPYISFVYRFALLSLSTMCNSYMLHNL